MSPRRRATQLNLHTALHQVSEKLLIRIAGRHHAFGIVRVIIQRHVACIRVKDRDDLGIGVPVGGVLRDEVKWKSEAGKSPSNAKAATLKATFSSGSFTGISMKSGFSELDMSKFPSNKEVFVVIRSYYPEPFSHSTTVYRSSSPPQLPPWSKRRAREMRS